MNALEHRIPPPLVVLIDGALMWLLSQVTGQVALPGGVRLGLTALIFALGLAVGASGLRAFARARTTIDPVNLQAASALVTTGIFRFSRNPMYLGFATLLTAWAVLLAAPWTLIGVLAFVLFIDRFQIVPEERVLSAKFGQSYDDYCSRVRRWV